MKYVYTLSLAAMVTLLLPMQACGQGHYVTLSWTASADQGVTYNIYRAGGACPATGLPSGATKVGSGITTLTWKDSMVDLGIYCYYATAEKNSLESPPSNTAEASVKPGAPSSLIIQSEQ